MPFKVFLSLHGRYICSIWSHNNCAPKVGKRLIIPTNELVIERMLHSHYLLYHRACDTMRCTDCDFGISIFNNLSWSRGTDYLFLRNNMPDYSRLKSQLVSTKGTSDPTSVSSVGDPKNILTVSSGVHLLHPRCT